MSEIDIVTVYHRDSNYRLAQVLERTLAETEDVPHTFIGVDNRKTNRGFAKGCNYGVKRGDSPIIGFLNPDVVIRGPFLGRILQVFEDPETVITGSDFGKPKREIKTWGCQTWVCGAAFFVRRDWFESRGGFDQADRDWETDLG